MTRAAALLTRAPFNVTTRIQLLEAELGTQLFNRHRKRMSLTDEGQTFLGYAERILNLADEAQQRLAPSSPRGTLRIGSMESTIASRLAGPLARYGRIWPEVTLELTSAPSGPLLDALRAHRIDCALVAFAGEEDRAQADDLELIPLFREELVLLLPSDHPEVRTASDLRLRVLAAFAPGCTYRKLSEDWLLAGGGRAEGAGGALLPCDVWLHRRRRLHQHHAAERRGPHGSAGRGAANAVDAGRDLSGVSRRVRHGGLQCLSRLRSRGCEPEFRERSCKVTATSPRPSRQRLSWSSVWGSDALRSRASIR
nr:LysR substrate-binding domain-containing protein [Rhodovulum sulfidophilum]